MQSFRIEAKLALGSVDVPAVAARIHTHGTAYALTVEHGTPVLTPEGGAPLVTNWPDYVPDETRALIEGVRAIARRHNWAIAVHGSLDRDIDLVAIPWTADAPFWLRVVDDLLKELDLTLGNIDRSKANGRMGYIMLRKGYRVTGKLTEDGKEIIVPPPLDISVIELRDPNGATPAPVAPAPAPEPPKPLRTKEVMCRGERDAYGVRFHPRWHLPEKTPSGHWVQRFGSPVAPLPKGHAMPPHPDPVRIPAGTQEGSRIPYRLSRLGVEVPDAKPGDLDSAGTPFDPTAHAKATNKNGTWKRNPYAKFLAEPDPGPVPPKVDPLAEPISEPEPEKDTKPTVLDAPPRPVEDRLGRFSASPPPQGSYEPDEDPLPDEVPEALDRGPVAVQLPPSPISENEKTHTLWVSGDPGCPLTVVDGGLSVCRICGAAESELDAAACTGRPGRRASLTRCH